MTDIIILAVVGIFFGMMLSIEAGREKPRDILGIGYAMMFIVTFIAFIIRVWVYAVS